MNDYHVIWETQSKNSSESMPVGGGDIGGNVWVEDNRIFLYLQQSGWFDENNSLLKAGRIRIEVTPNPFNESFKQELMLEEGYVNIKGDEFSADIWVDVNHSIIHVDYESVIPRKIRLSYESYRFQDRIVDNCSYELFQCKEVFFYPLQDPVFHKDQVLAESDKLFFYHDNDNDDLSIYKELMDQGLEQYAQEVFNPQKDLVFGGLIKGGGLFYSGLSEGVYQDTPYKAYLYETNEEQGSGSILISLSTIQTGRPTDLLFKLEAINLRGETHAKEDKRLSQDWWKQYFEKSFIMGNKEQAYFDILKNYQLFRYMLGCNYYGFWPTKFNGGLFTFDPSLGGDSPWSDDPLQYTPDFRLWGGGSHTIQNQRLLYWPMLKSGDAEVMKQHFDFFNRTLHTAQLRCTKSLNVEGAMYPEQVGTYGLCCGCDNEWGNKTGLPVSQIKYHFSNSLETALMILEYNRFTRQDISEYIPFMEAIVLFYHNFYDQDDEHGKMVMYPANALETYHVVKNPVDAIAGLQRVIERMLMLPDSVFSEEKKGVFLRIQKRVPDIKTRQKDNHTIIAYADTKSIIHNCEIPELYPVFPYGQFGIGKPELQLAIDTARYAAITEEQLTHISWHPTGIQYARLGMLKECEEFLFKKMGNGDFRFPAFFGPGHDWTPDHNWGGSGMIQLQEMLLQTEGTELRLLPCWNKEIDVHFRLYAPDNTIVECDYKDGSVVSLRVWPESRLKNVMM